MRKDAADILYLGMAHHTWPTKWIFMFKTCPENKYQLLLLECIEIYCHRLSFRYTFVVFQIRKENNFCSTVVVYAYRMPYVYMCVFIVKYIIPNKEHAVAGGSLEPAWPMSYVL